MKLEDVSQQRSKNNKYYQITVRLGLKEKEFIYKNRISPAKLVKKALQELGFEARK